MKNIASELVIDSSVRLALEPCQPSDAFERLFMHDKCDFTFFESACVLWWLPRSFFKLNGGFVQIAD